MTTYNQLSIEQRNIIQIMISQRMSFTKIGKAINKDRTTISKEIRRNRYIKNYREPFDIVTIQSAINNCEKLQSKPYCCNCCTQLHSCWKTKIYYNGKIAQEHYEQQLSDSRKGIDINPEVLDDIEHSIVPLIKEKKQSVNQVYVNHKDILYFSKSTFYRYVDNGIFSLTNLDLPKKVKYKERKKEVEKSRRELALLNGRRYENFLVFKTNHPKMHIVEMDTVIGTQTSDKVLLTLFFRDTHFMLIRLLDKKTINCVNAEIDTLKTSLGIKLYAKIFRIFLTDNGSEFFDPYHFEKDYNTHKKVTNLFYCNPNHPEQKGGIEKNHEFIRKVLPKGTNFDNFSNEQIAFLENTINNIPRDSLKGKTPFDLTKEKYPLFISKVNSKYISKDDVNLSLDAFNESAE